MNQHRLSLHLLVTFICIPILTMAQNPPQSLVAHSSIEETGEQGDLTAIVTTKPKIYQMHVKSNVRNRYVHTTVTSKVMNLAPKAQEAVFAVVLPETAFISGFLMEINGRNYTAYVKEKDEAERVYKEAVAKGSAAAHVALSARDSNRFIVSVNIQPETKAAFYLSYEELLTRQNGYYELVINIHPGQPVKDLTAEVIIAESRKITNLRTPPIRSGNEIGNENSELDPRVQWGIANDTSAVVMFTPNLERQVHLAQLLGTKVEDGLAGQFVVQYDVERDPKGGEVLIQDGYFAHFFAPTNLIPIPKHVVFVLDTSSSMGGQKIQQLREAMHKILEELHDKDLFHIVEFNSAVMVWNIENPDASIWFQEQNLESVFEKSSFPSGSLATSVNIKKAENIVSNLMVAGSTNIYSALHVGLHLVEISQKQNKDKIMRQPIIMFLTDGEPTVGVQSTQKIINDVTNVFNIGSNKSPIFSLSFGDGADKNFLQKLSLHNSGFSKHIYEAADASLQLQNFYKQISSPLLSNVTFKYETSVTSLTATKFPVYFSGSEIVVTGWCGTKDSNINPVVDAWNGNEYETFEPVVQRSISSVERMWAYLTIKQILEKREASNDHNDKEELKKKALELALKYSFVTSVSSLVVVKPDSTDAIDTEQAKRRASGYADIYLTGENPRGIGNPHTNGNSRIRFESVVLLLIITKMIINCI